MMTDEELAKYLHQQARLCQNREDGSLSHERTEILDRYRGDLYGENSTVAAEREGYSQFTTREVMEAVEWALPPVIKVFLSGDRIVEFEPISQEDEQLAAQETDIVNHKILRANGGDATEEIIKFVKDALMMPTAYMKVYVDEMERFERQELTGIDQMTLAGLVDDPDVEILEQRSYQEEIPVPVEYQQPGQPTAMLVELFDLDIRRTKRTPTLRLEAIPGEEVLVDGDLTKTNLDHANIVIHRQRKSHSDLLKVGYDEDELRETGAAADSFEWNEERVHRRREEDEHIGLSQAGTDEEADKMYEVYECYAQVDYNEDGKHEMRHVVMIGNTIFENEEINYQPFVAMSSLLNPHRHVGLSLAQLVMDLQNLNTVLHRQLLDNLWRLNTGKHVIAEEILVKDGSTLDAITDQSTHEVVIDARRSTFSPREMIFPLEHPSILRDVLPVIQDVERKTPMRTGVAPENDVDPEIIQQAKTGAFMSAQKAAYQRIELIIRVMAETGFKQIPRKVHRLIRMHPSIAESVRLRGTWVQPNPAQWIERTDMIVNVGLGFNGDEDDVQALTAIMAIQDKLMPMGLAGPREVFNAAEKLTRKTGLGSPTQFFLDPHRPDWQPPPPVEDPALIQAKATAQAVMQDAQNKGIEAQARMLETQQKGQIEMAKLSQEDQKEFIKLELEERKVALEERRIAVEERKQQMNEESELGERRKTEAETRLTAAKEVETLEKAGAVEAEVDIDREKVAVERKKAENPSPPNGSASTGA